MSSNDITNINATQNKVVDNTHNDNIKIIFLIISIVTVICARMIIIIILTSSISSIYFLLISTVFQTLIIYSLLYLLVKKYFTISIHYLFESWDLQKLLLYSAISTTFVNICIIYASNPSRTPIIIQTMLLGTSIIPAVLLSKYFLKKESEYHKVYISLSVICLLATLILSIIPVVQNLYWNTLPWIFLFFFGVMCICFYNVLVEKYFTILNLSLDVTSQPLYHKIQFRFYVTIFQFLFLLSCFWFEIFLGYGNEPWQNFLDTCGEFFSGTKTTLLIEISMLLYNLHILLILYLNSISSKYNMIIEIINNPVINVFFLLFPELNSGLQYPIYIVVPCLFTAILSVVLWIKGDSSAIKK
jgi:hypothetical protein